MSFWLVGRFVCGFCTRVVSRKTLTYYGEAMEIRVLKKSFLENHFSADSHQSDFSSFCEGLLSFFTVGQNDKVRK